MTRRRATTALISVLAVGGLLLIPAAGGADPKPNKSEKSEKAQGPKDEKPKTSEKAQGPKDEKPKTSEKAQGPNDEKPDNSEKSQGPKDERCDPNPDNGNGPPPGKGTKKCASP